MKAAPSTYWHYNAKTKLDMVKTHLHFRYHTFTPACVWSFFGSKNVAAPVLLTGST